MVINQAESIRMSLKERVCSQISLPDDASIVETTLIRNGSFCGRRFSLAGFSAVWFQEEGQIKLYEPSGRLEVSCSVAQFISHSVPNFVNSDLRRAA